MNIEERGFVVGVAFDLAEEQSGDSPMITMTNQFVVPAGFGTPSEGGNSSEKPYSNLSVTGQSLFEMTREMATIQGNAPYYEHLQSIVVAEELAQEPHMFENVMDLLIRDPEMRRETRVVVSAKKAKDILEIEPTLEPLPAMHINTVNDNIDRAGGLIQPLRIGELNEYMLEEYNYLIPIVRAFEDRIIFNGAGIFDGKSNQLVDTISGLEIFGVNLITGKLKGGFINFKAKDEKMVYEIKQAKSNIKIEADQTDHITIDIEIDTEGNIAETFGGRSLLDENYMEVVNKHLREEIKHQVTDILKKGQEEIGMDFFGFSKIMREKHYKTWEKIKGDWEDGKNIFQNATINVTVENTIRTVGTTNRTKDLKRSE
ncbi:germination protein GerLC [Oceanobacillus sp. J11TS1]|nr:germination protein GerLC [Oceanobacillus sp. J11TS1]